MTPPEYVLAAPGSGSPVVLDAALRPEDVNELRFAAPDGTIVSPKRNPMGEIEIATFLGLREIDVASVALFYETLGFAEDQRFDSLPIVRHCGISVVLIDDDANEREMFVEFDMIAPELLDRNVFISHSVDNPSLLLDENRSAQVVGEVIRRWAERTGVLFGHELLAAQLHGPAQFPMVEGVSVDNTAVSGVELLGSAPLIYPPAGSLPGKKGSRTDAELSGVPSRSVVERGRQRSPGRVDGTRGFRRGPIRAETDSRNTGGRSRGARQNDRGVGRSLELEQRGWVSSGGPRGSKWWVPDEIV